MREIERLHSSGLKFPANEGLLEALYLNDLKLISRTASLSKMNWILTNER